MKLSSLLLSADSYYFSEECGLPFRPEWDKQFLKYICEGSNVLCSENTIQTIPKSIRNRCNSLTTDTTKEWNVNLGVASFNEKSDLFIIIDSKVNMYFDSPVCVESNTNKKKYYFNINRLKKDYSLLGVKNIKTSYSNGVEIRIRFYAYNLTEVPIDELLRKKELYVGVINKFIFDSLVNKMKNY